MFRGNKNSHKGQTTMPVPPSGSYPTQPAYPVQGYSSAPPPPPNYYEPPPPYTQAPYAQAPPMAPPPQQQYYQQQQVGGARAVFDAAARFDGISQPRIPPPPPGYAPTPAQTASMQGQTVIASQQRSTLWSGSGDGGISWGI